MKNYTDDELAVLIDQSLKQTARDVREARIPLDGRARLPSRDVPSDASTNTKISDAAE
jgi:hypothetical protein